MKRLRASLILVIVTIGVLGLLISCFNQMSGGVSVVPKAALTYPPVIDPDPIGGPDSPLPATLYAGQSIDVGTVNVWLDGESLCVQFSTTSTTWSLVETHLDVVTNPAEFPQTKKGNPIPGHFAYKMTHDPETSEYTYCLDVTGYNPEDIVYIAAHAEVEQWVDGACVNSESAWATGYDFPGANWATYFAGIIPAPPAPIDVTGYWVWYFTVPGMGELGPVLLYIHQAEDNKLYANMGMSGSISDSTIDLHMPEGQADLLGTVSGDVITGEITSVMFPGIVGSFEMHRPTESNPPFGHLALEGNVGDIPILLNEDFEEFGLGTEVSVEQNGGWESTHFEARYFNHELEVTVWMSVSGLVDPIGEFDPQVTYNVPDVWLSLRWLENGQGLWDYNIEVDSGWLTLTRFSEDGYAGSFNIFNEDGEGDWLIGNFDLSCWEEWQPPEG